MNGGPIDLTPFGAILTAIGIFYWLCAAAAVWFALWYARTRRGKIVFVTTVMLAFGAMPVSVGWDAYQARRKFHAALAHFDMRCKSAGEKITKTVQNVEGVVWMKWRSKEMNFSDQFKLDDPYGADCYGDDCILRLLRVTKGVDLNPEEANRHMKGYRFVETIDPNDGKRYRYFGVMALGPSWTKESIERQKKNAEMNIPEFSYRFLLEREPIDQYTARYGIAWDDISTHEDREKWIAGGMLKIIDLQTNEIIAERTGYMIDKGLGDVSGFRSPWSFAQEAACPSHYSGSPVSYSEKTRPFASKVLQPIQ